MDEDIREAMAEQMGMKQFGFNWCFIKCQYMPCDDNCDECKIYIDFEREFL